MKRITICSPFLILAALSSSACTEVDDDPVADVEAAVLAHQGTPDAISAGGSHACALTHDGGVRCWGLNSNGQLGDGTTTNAWSPVASQLSGRAIAVSAGFTHTCALVDDGTVQCWGDNTYGELGGPAGAARAIPAPVPAVSQVRALTTGLGFTCALGASGHVSCWGKNNFGQLGHGTLTTSEGVGEVTLSSGAALTNIVQVSASGDRACALSAHGSVYCWGENYDHAVTTVAATTLPRATYMPTPVSGVLAAGDGSICGLAADGTPWCTGLLSTTSFGTLKLTTLTVGYDHGCGISRGTVAYCWGKGSSGQLGDGGYMDHTIPVMVSGSTSENAVDAGKWFGCALRGDGSVRCWGAGGQGQLGNGANAFSRVPVLVSGLAASIGWNVAVGGNSSNGFACALATDGHVSCLGANSGGQLGIGAVSPATLTGERVVGISDALTISAGELHACALRSSGSVMCWGDNTMGQLGDNSTTRRTVATTVYLSGGMTDVSVGRAHSCALRASGTVACWGSNASGALGRGIVNSNSLIVGDVQNLPTAVDIDAAGRGTCALTVDGEVWCWGENSYGQLGDGTAVDRGAPVHVTQLDDAVAIAAGEYHSCAVKADGTVHCWGDNAYGELGDNTTFIHYTPTNVVGVSDAVAVAVGSFHSCALTSTGKVKCWGYGYNGALGNGGTANQLVAVDVAGSDHFVALEAGAYNTCATRADGTTACWGVLGSSSSGAYSKTYVPATVTF